MHRGCNVQSRASTALGTSVGAADVGGHAPRSSVQRRASGSHAPDSQSKRDWQRWPKRHGSHAPPPQSAAVSSPFCTPSSHVSGLGVGGKPLGASVGAVGCAVGDAHT